MVRERVYFMIKISEDGERWVNHYRMSSWKFDTYEKALEYVEYNKAHTNVSERCKYFKIVKCYLRIEELEEVIL